MYYAIATLITINCAMGCDKEPETVYVTNTVFETDTVISVVKDTLVITVIDTLNYTDTVTIVNNISDTVTTLIVLRHAEKQSTGTNPSLSTAGQIRANNLSNILTNVNLDAIYSTNYNRTIQTVQPTATAKTISVSFYNPSSLTPFVDHVLSTYHDGTILVVGHSNTTPSLLNVLTGTSNYSNIPESEYDNLYIVTVFEKGRAEVVHFKY